MSRLCASDIIPTTDFIYLIFSFSLEEQLASEDCALVFQLSQMSICFYHGRTLNNNIHKIECPFLLLFKLHSHNNIKLSVYPPTLYYTITWL